MAKALSSDSPVLITNFRTCLQGEHKPEWFCPNHYQWQMSWREHTQFQFWVPSPQHKTRRCSREMQTSTCSTVLQFFIFLFHCPEYVTEHTTEWCNQFHFDSQLHNTQPEHIAEWCRQVPTVMPFNFCIPMSWLEYIIEQNTEWCNQSTHNYYPILISE